MPPPDARQIARTATVPVARQALATPTTVPAPAPLSRAITSPGVDVPATPKAKVIVALQRTAAAPTIATIIDSQNLDPDATSDDIILLCADAVEHGFRSVCVAPCNLALAKRELDDALTPHTVLLATVVGYPLGSSLPAVKAFEAAAAVQEGAEEILMVMNLGWFLAGGLDHIKNEIKEVIKAASGRLVTVVIETAKLKDEEVVMACQVVKAAGAACVQTCTGFYADHAMVGRVALMRHILIPVALKAAGGVTTRAQADTLIKAGATRISTSHALDLLKETKPK